MTSRIIDGIQEGSSRVIDGIQEGLAKLGPELYENSDQILLVLALLALAVFIIYVIPDLIEWCRSWFKEDRREPSNRRHHPMYRDDKGNDK